MNATTKNKWNIERIFLQACTATTVSVRIFRAADQGFCEGMGAWKINQGSYGDVKLDGLGFAFARALAQGDSRTAT